jgi:hypothetical protein
MSKSTNIVSYDPVFQQTNPRIQHKLLPRHMRLRAAADHRKVKRACVTYLRRPRAQRRWWRKRRRGRSSRAGPRTGGPGGWGPAPRTTGRPRASSSSPLTGSLPRQLPAAAGSGGTGSGTEGGRRRGGRPFGSGRARARRPLIGYIADGIGQVRHRRLRPSNEQQSSFYWQSHLRISCHPTRCPLSKINF